MIKALLTSVFVTVLAANCSMAQLVPPPYAGTPVATAHTYITNYQQHSVDHHPSAFLMKASGLKSYLNSCGANDSVYLQAYFGSLSSVTEDNFVAFIGLNKNETQFFHDPNMSFLYATSKTDPNLCTVFDPLLDDVDHYDPELCDIANCQNKTYNKPAMKTYIANYQAFHPQGTGPNYDNTQSFLINATALRKFLNQQDTVIYLQVYLGRKNALPNKDKLALIIAGVDATGKHVFFNGTMVMDEVQPCPRCEIQFDNSLDSEKQ